MQNFHIKSVLLGAGIGIVLTSIISMIYLAGAEPKMSREEIISEARKLGMVENTELVSSTPQQEKEDASKQTQSVSEIKKDGTDKVKESQVQSGPAHRQKPVENSSVSQAKPQEQEIQIRVNPGDSSEIVADKLLKAGLIADKSAFIKQLSDMGLASEINIGVFKIKQESDVKTIIRILTTVR